MHFILFKLKRFFLFLTDAVVFPIRAVREMWLDQSRGRTALFGGPALLIAVAAIGAALVAHVGKESLFSKSYENAKNKAVQEKSFSDAVCYIQKLMELKPNDDDIKIEYAQILAMDTSEETRQGNRQLAKSIYLSLAPEDRPGHPDAHVIRAQQLLSTSNQPVAKRMEMAEKQLKFALETDSDHLDAKTLLAQLYTSAGEFENALQQYRDLYENYVGYHIKIVELLVRLNRGQDAKPVIEEAIGRYQNLLDEDPDNINYLRRLANCYSMLEQFDESVKILNAAIANSDDSKEIESLKLALSNVYLAKTTMYGRDVRSDPEARQHYLECLINSYQIYPKNELTMARLTSFSLAGFPESDAARQVYDGRQDPDNAPDAVLQQLGTMEILRGSSELGIELLEKGLQRNPQNHAILNNLAFSLMNTQLERANDLSNRAVALSPKQPNYLDTRGHLRMKMGEFKKAINDFENALALDKARPTGAKVLEKNYLNIYLALAECYQRQGMMDDANAYQNMAEELKNKQGLNAPTTNNQ